MFPTKLEMSKLVIKCSWSIAGDFPSMGRFINLDRFGLNTCVLLLALGVLIVFCLSGKTLYDAYLLTDFFPGLNRSVFFRGQIERPSSSVFSNILGNSDLPVRVAINRERVHVIDDNKNVCICCTTNSCLAGCNQTVMWSTVQHN